MSEEVKIKISQPMFEVGELERFDNYIHSIVEEYSKLIFKEKDQILTQRIIMKQEQEIERLTFESTKWESKFYDEAKKVDRAIEFIKENENNISSIKDLENNKTYNSALLYVKSILQGSDKE